jgi:hypothetical protein
VTFNDFFSIVAIARLWISKLLVYEASKDQRRLFRASFNDDDDDDAAMFVSLGDAHVGRRASARSDGGILHDASLSRQATFVSVVVRTAVDNATDRHGLSTKATYGMIAPIYPATSSKTRDGISVLY